ncbi:MAG: MFS transporter [Duganella sp.]
MSPASPRSTPPALVALFACASGLCVANVYYAQPLLEALAAAFAIPRASVGGVVTATQAGSVLALLLLVPLGDRLPRRQLLLVQLLALVGALTMVATAARAPMLLAGMLMVGMLGTAMTQGLIAYAAAASGPHERGRVVGAAQGGVVAGLLLARVLAGVVADLAGWRAVYGGAALAMLLMAPVLWRRLPALPAQQQLRPPHLLPQDRLCHHSLSYPRLVGSMVALLREDRVLRVRGMLALLMFAAFNILWSALVLPLSAPPYMYSHSAIGAFGLVGLAGALGAARAGRWVDRGHGQRTSLAALLLLLAAWLPLGLAFGTGSTPPWTMSMLVIGIVMLDLGVQALQVTNQGLILRASTATHSRLVGCYMLFYAVGSGAGALASTSVYAMAGWSGVCWLGAAVSLAALMFWGIFGRQQAPAAEFIGP